MLWNWEVSPCLVLDILASLKLYSKATWGMYNYMFAGSYFTVCNRHIWSSGCCIIQSVYSGCLMGTSLFSVLSLENPAQNSQFKRRGRHLVRSCSHLKRGKKQTYTKPTTTKLKSDTKLAITFWDSQAVFSTQNNFGSTGRVLIPSLCIQKFYILLGNLFWR